MKRLASLAVAAALTAAGSRAMAQLPGIPYQPVETGTGISIAADYGKPSDSLGGGSAYGLTGGLGLGRIGVSASVGAMKPKGNGATSQTSFGGRAGLKLIGGGLVPLQVGVQVGASSIKVANPLGGSVTSTLVLPGAYVKVSPPLFPLKPFGMVYYRTGSCGSGCSIDKEARFTIGANFNLLLGLGVHAAFDTGKSGHVWGVGAHFNFRVPGLPGVP